MPSSALITAFEWSAMVECNGGEQWWSAMVECNGGVLECSNGGVQWWSGIAAANGGVQLPPLALHLHSTCTPFATLTLTLTLTSQVCRFAGDEFSSRTACDMSDEPSVYAEATHHGATLLAILPPLSTAQNFPSSESSTPLFEPRTPSPPPFIDDYMEDDESPSPSTTLSRNLPSIFNEDLHAIYDKAHPQVGLLSDTVYHKLLKDQYKFTVTPFYPPTVPFEYSTSYRKRTRYLMETAPALPPAALLECSLAPDYTPGYPLWIGADITRVCRFEYTFDFLLRPSALGGPALLDYTLICNYGTTWLTFLLEHSLAPGPSLLSFTMERLHEALRRRSLPDGSPPYIATPRSPPDANFYYWSDDDIESVRITSSRNIYADEMSFCRELYMSLHLRAAFCGLTVRVTNEAEADHRWTTISAYAHGPPLRNYSLVAPHFTIDSTTHSIAGRGFNSSALFADRTEVCLRAHARLDNLFSYKPGFSIRPWHDLTPAVGATVAFVRDDLPASVAKVTSVLLKVARAGRPIAFDTEGVDPPSLVSLGCWHENNFFILLEERPFSAALQVFTQSSCPLLVFGESDDADILKARPSDWKTRPSNDAKWLCNLLDNDMAKYAKLRTRLVDLQHSISRFDRVLNYPSGIGARNLTEAFALYQGNLLPTSSQWFTSPVDKNVKERFFYPDGYKVPVSVPLVDETPTSTLESAHFAFPPIPMPSSSGSDGVYVYHVPYPCTVTRDSLNRDNQSHSVIITLPDVWKVQRPLKTVYRNYAAADCIALLLMYYRDFSPLA